LDKRVATLQLYIRASGEQNVPPELIFRGKGVQLTEPELRFYDSLQGKVRVYFQPKAWADEEVMLQSLEHFLADTRDSRANGGEVLLGMDQHAAQQTTKYRARAHECGVFLAYTPGDCTDVVAPVDHHVGAAMKSIINLFFHEEMSLCYDRWMDEGVGAAEVRMLLASWVAQAWDIVKCKADFLRSAFVSTGFLLAKDGSEDHKINIGYPGYKYRV
jgi:hypothetical protein